MSKLKKKYRVYAIASSFVFEVIITVGIFVTAGYFLDVWLNTVVFIIIFSILGVFAGIYNLIRKVNKVE